MNVSEILLLIFLLCLAKNLGLFKSKLLTIIGLSFFVIYVGAHFILQALNGSYESGVSHRLYSADNYFNVIMMGIWIICLIKMVKNKMHLQKKGEVQ